METGAPAVPWAARCGGPCSARLAPALPLSLDLYRCAWWVTGLLMPPSQEERGSKCSLSFHSKMGLIIRSQMVRDNQSVTRCLSHSADRFLLSPAKSRVPCVWSAVPGWGAHSPPPLPPGLGEGLGLREGPVGRAGTHLTSKLRSLSSRP